MTRDTLVRGCKMDTWWGARSQSPTHPSLQTALPTTSFHTSPPLPHLQTQVWSLQEQISHKVSFLREHVLLPGRPPVVLVGHSIGAAMMIRVRGAGVRGLGCGLDARLLPGRWSNALK